MSLKIHHAANPSEVVQTALHEVREGLGAMLGSKIESEIDSRLDARELRIQLDAKGGAPIGGSKLHGDSFEISRSDGAIVLRAGSERGLIHAAADLLEKLGARFSIGNDVQIPRIDVARLAAIAPYKVEPAFTRRAFVSDIMTWNYSYPDRLQLHLEYDSDFVKWMARRGLNAFEYIRHAHDTRIRIDELLGEYRRHGIASEYGGHVLPLLLPRDRFESHPEFFPARDDGQRSATGNLCVSSDGALQVVREGALAYVDEFPENELLHVWGADVRGGAWCRCGQCRALSPQLQYMKVVNAIASALGERAEAPPVAYLAYHDTIAPDRDLKPLPNVCFEWAPRERCYVHGIDDRDCEINPRYFDSLKRYIDIFDGRGHVFEYYADAILFGGLGFAMPDVIVRDLRAYHALGIRGVSCLTFGGYSGLTYPANLETFARATRSLSVDPTGTLDTTAAGRHPRCAAAMSDAYRAIERASKLVLDYGDVVLPTALKPERAARKRGELAEASRIFRDAIAAADQVAIADRDSLVAAERELWAYSSETLAGLAEWLAACQQSGAARQSAGEAAVSKVIGAIEHIRAIAPALKNTWGAYDLEWMRELWLNALRERLA